MMIIDAHAHIFQTIHGERQGLPTKSLASGMVGVGEGSFQFLPTSYQETSFPVEALVEAMDEVGVHKAVLLQNPVIGIINEEVKQAIKKFPGRFKGTIQVDPMDVNATEVISSFASENQNTIKLEISEGWGWSGKHKGLSLTGDELMKIWEAANELGLRVIIDPGDILENGYQVANIQKIASSFPGVKILVAHLGYMTAQHLNNPKAVEIRKNMLRLARECKNVFFGLSATAALLDEVYPCPLSISLFREAIDIMGANKLLWGTDIPTTFKKCSYQQMIDLVRIESTFLSPLEKEKIIGLNALTFFDF
ncbi:MAG: amidohydrolase family protein [Bacteroidota bacterium]